MACEQLATKDDIQAVNDRLQSIESILNTLPNKSYLEALIDGLKLFIEVLFNRVFEKLTNLQDSLIAAINGLKEVIVSAINGLKEVIVSAINGLKDTLITALESIRDSIVALLNTFLEALKLLFGDGQSNIDYTKIERFHQETRFAIINKLIEQFDSVKVLLNQIIGLINKGDLNIDYEKINNYIKQSRDEILDNIRAFQIQAIALLTAILEAVLALNSIIPIINTVLGILRFLESLLNNNAKIDYSIIEEFHLTTRQIILNYLSGSLTVYFGQVQDKLNYIISLISNIKLPEIDYDKIKCEIDYSIIEGFHFTTRESILVGVKGHIEAALISVHSKLNQIIDLIRNLKCEIDYSIIEGFHFTTRESILVGVKGHIEAALISVHSKLDAILNKLNGLKLDIDYERIENFDKATRDYLTNELNNRMELLNSIFAAMFDKLNYLIDKLGVASIIKAGICADGIYTASEISTINLSQTLTVLSNQLSEFYKHLCETAIPALAVPEWWQVRLGAKTPQIACTFRKGITRSYHNIAIPHPKSINPVTTPLLPSYQKGSIQGMVVCEDNSKFIINCVSREEAERMCNIAIGLIDPNYLNENPKVWITERKGYPIGEEQMHPSTVCYYSTGQQNLMPDWRRRVNLDIEP